MNRLKQRREVATTYEKQGVARGAIPRISFVDGSRKRWSVSCWYSRRSRLDPAQIDGVLPETHTRSFAKGISMRARLGRVRWAPCPPMVVHSQEERRDRVAGVSTTVLRALAWLRKCKGLVKASRETRKSGYSVRAGGKQAVGKA